MLVNQIACSRDRQNLPLFGHCKEGATAQLSGRTAAPGRTQGCPMISFNLLFPRKPGAGVKAALVGAAALAALAMVSGCSRNSSSAQTQAASPNDPVVARSRAIRDWHLYGCRWQFGYVDGKRDQH